MAVRPIPLETTDDVAREDQVGMLIAGVNGLDTGAWRLVGGSADGEALLQVANPGSGEGLSVADGASISGGLSVAGGVTVQSGGAAITGDLGVSGAAGIGGTLAVAGNATLGDAPGDAHAVNGSLSVTNGLSVANGLTVSAGGATVTGPTALVGTLTVRDAGGGSVPLFADPTNTRVIVGATTPLAGAADDRFTVVGGKAYFGEGIGIRTGGGAADEWLVTTSAGGLAFATGGTPVLTLGAVSHDAVLTGDVQVTDNLDVVGDLSVTGGAVSLAASTVTVGESSGEVGFFGQSGAAIQTVTGTLSGSPTTSQLAGVVRSLLSALDQTGYSLVVDATV